MLTTTNTGTTNPEATIFQEDGHLIKIEDLSNPACVVTIVGGILTKQGIKPALNPLSIAVTNAAYRRIFPDGSNGQLESDKIFAPVIEPLEAGEKKPENQALSQLHTILLKKVGTMLNDVDDLNTQDISKEPEENNPNNHLVEVVGPDNKKQFFQVDINPLLVDQRNSSHVLVQMHDVTGLKEQAQKALTDEITELYNMRWISEHLEGLLADGANVGVISIDMKRFKRINDEHGHLAGDEALREVAGILQRSIREKSRNGERPEEVDCVVVRRGGDEFQIILRNCKEDAMPSIIGRIQSSFDAHNSKLNNDNIIPNQPKPLLEINIGGVHSAELKDVPLGQRANAALEISDQRMYEDKILQRNVFLNENMATMFADGHEKYAQIYNNALAIVEETYATGAITSKQKLNILMKFAFDIAFDCIRNSKRSCVEGSDEMVNMSHLASLIGFDSRAAHEIRKAMEANTEGAIAKTYAAMKALIPENLAHTKERTSNTFSSKRKHRRTN